MYITRRGALPSQDFVVFSFPPIDVSLPISLDASREMYERVHSNCIYAYLMILPISTQKKEKQEKEKKKGNGLYFFKGHDEVKEGQPN